MLSEKKLTNCIIDIHADDYALSDNSDTDIINLCLNGKLDSISIIPNLNIFYESVKKFIDSADTFPKNVKVSVHLNFMEGKSVLKKEDVPNLVDKNGFFNVSWGKLILWNYNPFLRKKIKEELKVEITAQIKKCIESGIINENFIRIDSHQHPHMIPIFFEALCNSISENNFSISYIRNSQDPIVPYITTKNAHPGLINLIKCFILNFYSIKVRHYLKTHKLPIQILGGVAFSGLMNNRVFLVINKLIGKCRKNETLEILFHPGTMYNKELTEEFTKIGFNEFHLSSNRETEYKTCEGFHYGN